MNLINNINAIQIHDDLLGYMSDTLQWIPTYNPAKSEKCMGLCWYGSTVIKSEGAKIAGQIFRPWAELFSCGSKVLQLTGSWGVEWEEGSPVSEGEYERINVGRDEIVNKMKVLADLADQVAESNDM
jgi:hypothetical protein